MRLNNRIFVKAPEHIIKENLQDRFIFLISKLSLHYYLMYPFLLSKIWSFILEEAGQTIVSLQEQAESQARQALQSIIEHRNLWPNHHKILWETKSTQVSFDKAEITPMVDINSEENQMLFWRIYFWCRATWNKDGSGLLLI